MAENFLISRERKTPSTIQPCLQLSLRSYREVKKGISVHTPLYLYVVVERGCNLDGKFMFL